ncbi:MAG TPA: hypothetical protein VK669_04930 [Candidatus Limnocylindrales bacterium]|nr:hypothetical protein [Candidatus Limnocylindrales bacterium]
MTSPEILDGRDSEKIGRTPIPYAMLWRCENLTPETIASTVRQAEAGTSLAEIRHKLGILALATA